MSPDDYLINELAKQAGVSVRTIRYYIDEGLLPPPETKGRYASFGEEYLDLLELIRRLKEAFLPLKEIRERVAGLTHEQVRALLAELDQEGKEAEKYLPSIQANIMPFMQDDYVKESLPKATKKTKELSSALDYVNQVLNTQDASNKYQQPSRGVRQGETWQRIRIAPGVELHVRISNDPLLSERIRDLTDYARDIFSKSQ